MKPEKIGIKIILFLIFGSFIFGILQKVLIPKWTIGFFDGTYMDSETNRYETFYQLKPNSLDYIVVGHSKTFHSVNPMAIYADTGYMGYDLGCGSEGIGLSYYWMEEALKYQTPSYIFWDASALLSESAISTYPPTDAATAAKALVNMRFGLTKIRACIDNQTESRDWIQLLFPLLAFHTRWDELKEEDFFHDNDDYVTMGAVISFGCKFNTHLTKANGTDYLFYDLSGEAEQYYREISEENRNYFEKMYSLCEKNKVRFIPFFGATTRLTDKSKDLVREFLEDYKLYCLDFTDEEMGIDWKKDSGDTGYHTNYWGAAKFSEQLSEWMKEQGEICRPQNTEAEAFWDEKLEKYQELETKGLMRTREQVLSYLNTLKANEDKCVVFITVKDEACASSDEYLENYLRQLGLQGGFSENNLQKSYLAVIDKGKVLIERWEAAPIRLEDNYTIADGTELHVQMRSGGLVYSNTSKIQIDNINYAVGSRGLNIVVLDKESGEVISSVGIDTHKEEWGITRKALNEDATDIWEQYEQNARILPDGIYTIHPYGNLDYALDICGGVMEDDANLQLLNSTGVEAQQFELEYVGEGLYTMKAMNSGKYLTAYHYGNTNETNVVQDTYTGLANQKWYIYRDSNGAYCVMSHYNKLVMDVAGTKSGPEVNIFLYEPVQGDWQTFEFRKAENAKGEK